MNLVSIVLGVLVFLFLAGVADIGRNPRLGPVASISRQRRQAAGATDHGPFAVLVLALVTAIVVVSGAVAVVEGDDGLALRFDAGALAGLTEGAG